MKKLDVAREDFFCPPKNYDNSPIRIYSPGYSSDVWKYKKFLFPSGELGIEFEKKFAHDYPKIVICAEITNSEEILELMMVSNYIKYWLPETKVVLWIPYIPFGRQDRHTSETSPWSLKVLADMINSCKFDEVITFTPHSNVTGILINNLTAYEFYQDPTGNAECDFRYMFSWVRGRENPPVFIAPDAGADKRTYECAKHYGVEEVFTALKRRNPVTGEIYGYTVPQDIPEDRDIIVIDDICDGGRTFIELAKQLPKKRKSLKLWVTHGIFSKGRQVLLDNGYDEVKCGFDFIEQRYFNDL